MATSGTLTGTSSSLGSGLLTVLSSATSVLGLLIIQQV